MGIWKAAWKAIWGPNDPPETKPTPMRRSGKTMPLNWPDNRLDVPQWQLIDYEAYVNEGFDRNTLVYSAIMYKARAQSSIPLRAYKGDPDNPTPLKEKEPLAQLCARPNPHMAWRTFHMLRVIYLNTSGNSFTLLDRPVSGGLPTALYALRPDRVYIVPTIAKKGLLGYLYVPEGHTAWEAWTPAQRREAINSGHVLPILPQDMMHTKYPWPGDPLEGLGYGLSPISPAAFSVDVDNEVTRFLKLFFQKGALPAGLLKFADALDPETMAGIRQRWNEVYGGVDAWTEIGVMDQGGEFQRVGFTFEELGFDGIDERNESRILGPLGVPPILIGTRVGLNRATYSNAQEARQACWEDTLQPDQMLFQDEDQYYLQDEDGKQFVRYDFSDVPALQKNKTEQVAAAYQMWQMGTPADIAYQTVGLRVEQFISSEQGFLPLGVQTVETALEPPPEPGPTPPQLLPFTGEEPTPEPEPEPEAPPPESNNEGAAEAEEELEEEGAKAAAPAQSKGWTPEQKDAQWKRVDATARRWEPRFSADAAKALEQDRRHILAIVREGGKSARRDKASVNLDLVAKSIAEYMAEASPEIWRETFAPVVAGVIVDQGEKWAAELGVAWNVRNVRAEKWFENYMLKFAQPIDTTTSAWLDYVLQKAMAEGWSIDQLTNAIGGMFDVWTDEGAALTEEQAEWFGERLPQYRRENIARTETIKASNSGSNSLFKEWGVSKKEWLSTRDNRTRDAHLEADGQVVGIDEDFKVGGERLSYPGDPRGSAENVCECRCTVSPVMGD